MTFLAVLCLIIPSSTGHKLITFLVQGPAMPTMIQSPPQQITSPSLQQSQFTFPPNPINTVRPATQPPVIPQQPGVVYVRTPEIPPTQIMTSKQQSGIFVCMKVFCCLSVSLTVLGYFFLTDRPPGPQPFQGNWAAFCPRSKSLFYNIIYLNYLKLNVFEHFESLNKASSLWVLKFSK